jgi:hypothetical protein
VKEPTTALEALSIIRKFLSKNNYESYKLWHILTALRGPDYLEDGDKGEVKGATTEVIRHFAVGDSNCECIGSLSGKDNAKKAGLRKQLANTDHFWAHAKLAFVALGLKWEKKNES